MLPLRIMEFQSQPSQCMLLASRQGGIVTALRLWCILFALTSASAAQMCVSHIVVPEYPRLARQAQLAGVVTVSFTIRPDGTVASAKGSGAHNLLNEAVERNIKQWRFCSADERSSGTQQTTFSIEFAFRLEGKQQYEDAPSKVVMQLPVRVEITTRPPEPQT